MPTAPLAELDGVARRLAGDRFEDYSARALARGYEEYTARGRRAVGPVALASGDRSFGSFYELLADPTVTLGEAELRFVGGAPADTGWDFLLPFDRIAFHSDGSGELHPAGGAAPRRAIVRVLLREHFLARTRAEEERGASGGARVALPGLFGTLEQGLGICRTQVVLPFAVAVLVYLPEQRARYELDLSRMVLLADPRAGRLPVARRVVRSSRVSWVVDRKVGRGDLSLLAARCLEVLVESNGLSTVELSHLFGGVRELVDSAVQGLVQRRLATFDRRTGVYRARLEAFHSEVRAPEEPAPSADPALRTSVQELLAAADARATCPLCGRHIPPAPGSILCPECATMVAAG
jgi:hypothetical protein